MKFLYIFMFFVTVNSISQLSDSRQKSSIDTNQILQLIEESKECTEFYEYISKGFDASADYKINGETFKSDLSKNNNHLMKLSNLFMNRSYQYISKYLRYYCKLSIEYINHQELDSKIIHSNRVSDLVNLNKNQDFNIVTFLYNSGVEIEPVFRAIYYLRSFSKFETDVTLIETLKNILKTLKNSIKYTEEDVEMESLLPKFEPSNMTHKSHINTLLQQMINIKGIIENVSSIFSSSISFINNDFYIIELMSNKNSFFYYIIETEQFSVTVSILSFFTFFY